MSTQAVPRPRNRSTRFVTVTFFFALAMTMRLIFDLWPSQKMKEKFVFVAADEVINACRQAKESGADGKALAEKIRRCNANVVWNQGLYDGDHPAREYMGEFAAVMALHGVQVFPPARMSMFTKSRDIRSEVMLLTSRARQEKIELGWGMASFQEQMNGIMSRCVACSPFLFCDRHTFYKPFDCHIFLFLTNRHTDTFRILILT